MSCLSEDAVMLLASGKIRDTAIEPIEAHLDVCRPCRLLVTVYAGQSGQSRHARNDTLSAFAAGDLLAARYEVTGLLGRGGMGEVYAARDLVLGEVVALKTIAVGTEAADDLVTRLKREVQLARRVTHRNVCRVFDVGFHAEGDFGTNERISIPFFTMELLPGETLRKRLHRSGPLPPDEVMALLEQMAEALDAAHAAGVVHTDLKSDNVMLVPEPTGTRVVITDFGLAQTVDGRSASGRSRAAAVAGTLGYMAPEQLAGRATGPATDVYALAVVMVEALTGRLPTAQLSGAAGLEQWSLDPTFDRALPMGWGPPLRRCLDSSPAARFERASQLREALAAAARQQAGAAPRSASRRARHVGAPVAIIIATGVLVLAIGMAGLLRTNGRSRARLPVESDPRRASRAAVTAPARPVRREPLWSEPLDPTPEPAVQTASAAGDGAMTYAGLRRAHAPVIRDRMHPPSPRRPPAGGPGLRFNPEARSLGAKTTTASPPPAVAPVEDDDFIDPFPSR